jgi:hypothetical protein
VPNWAPARSAVLLGISLLNFVLYGFGFLLGARLLYAGHSRPLLMCASFLAGGAVSRLWSARWWSVVVPAAAGFVWGLGALKWAIHLTDTGGDYAPPMTQYIFSPSSTEVLWALAAAAAAGIGWWAAMRLAGPGHVTSHQRQV